MTPAIFKLYKYLDQFHIIFQLRIHHLNILIVLSQKYLEVSKSLLNALSQISDRFGLRRADPSEYALRGKQNLAAEIVTAHALGIRYTVDFTEDSDKFWSFFCVFGGVDHDTATGFFLLLDLSQVFVSVNRLSYVTSCISFD